AYLSDSSSRPYAGFQRYQIRTGDSWWRISNRSGVPIEVLKRVNDKTANLLRPGQWIMIPGKGGAVVAESGGERKTREIARARANYTVGKGDSLWAISKKFGASVDSIAKANGLKKSSTLSIGQKLYIPGTKEQSSSVASRDPRPAQGSLVQYLVRQGDTLWDISRKFGVSTKDLQAWNRMGQSSRLRPGDKLKIFVP
ncbi:MAG: LysM peptidoglycan-binding domain-containing protein, partial [Deltaproteobacteria bacterium]|nr:LysM peptidoglycan-binding domain-containing protein [Deltaproteobacteria bacterium]